MAFGVCYLNYGVAKAVIYYDSKVVITFHHNSAQLRLFKPSSLTLRTRILYTDARHTVDV